MSDAAIQVTGSAVDKLQQLGKEEQNTGLNLRVYITGGGCAGFSYGFKFDDQVNDMDTVVENGDVKVVVDSLSIQYLDGSELDYQENLMGSRFVINNPNATTTCGCGSSFSI
ncbi:MAG: iron-sulfur cluster insertion protein ErpA [Pseudomonadota bacterium]|nr:iron-sulfur cluster insertion protein ErpA [Pseudomonadota bacterium]